MSIEGTLEGMTLAVSKLKESVASIKDVYRRMPILIDEEHAAIRESNLERCEAIAQKKVSLGSTIDGAYAELKNAVRNLVEVYTTLTEKPVQSINTLSEAFPLIEDGIEVLKANGQPTAVIDHLFDGVKSELEHFLQIKQESSSKIEVNRMVLSRLLANRQENYRFWQEVAADTMASYDAGGKQRSKQRSSTLTIKA